MKRRWTDDQVAHMARRAFDENAPASAIAGEMSVKTGRLVTVRAVNNALWRHVPDRRTARRDGVMQAASARNNKIRRAIEGGASYATVARRFGLVEDYVREICPAGHARLSWQKRIRLLRRAGIETGPSWAGDFPVDPALEGDVTTAGVSFDDLRRRDCRYPIGKDAAGGYRFCGCARRDGSSYCAAHRAVCTQTINDNKPAARDAAAAVMAAA